MKKERVVNIRFLFCLFIGLMIGIIVSKLFLFQQISLVTGIITFLIVLIISIIGFVYGYKTREFNLQFKARRNVSKILMFSSVGLTCAFVIGFLISIIPFNNLLQVKQFDGEYTITGIVCDYVDSEETYKKFLLRDCEIVSNGELVELDYKVMIYTNSQTNIDLGNRVTFTAELEKCEVTNKYGFNSLINKIAYSTYVSSSDLLISDGSISVKDYIHNLVFDLLENNLNSENASICYSILFGQKEGLDEGISEMFSYAGISHILAVSGLHIGVLVSIIWFVLRKIKTNKYVRLVVFAVVLLFYAYLCSFSPSVCRAGIMAFVLAMCKSFSFEYDALSSLSIAGIVILLIEPYKLFSISFQLSFMCIYSIIAFAPAIQYLLLKIKCPKTLASNLAVSVAINVMIIPIAINAFGEVSLLGVISNLVVLPLFSVVYVLLFTVVLISVIIKPLGILLAIPNLFLHIIKVVANFVSSIPFGVFKVFNVSYWLVALIIISTLILHYVMSKHWLKAMSIVIILSIISLIFAINLTPKSYEGDNVIIASQSSSNVIVCVSNDSVSLVGSDITYKNLMFIMKDIRINKIDNIYAYDLQLNEISELQKIIEEYSVDSVYIPEQYDYNELRSNFRKTEIININETINNISLSIIDYKDETIAIELICGENTILVPNINNNKTENNYLINNHLVSRYLVINDYDDWSLLENYNGIIHNLNEETIIVRG